MADTTETESVRRDIEMTRERMSSTLEQLERKMNVMQMIRDHPWPALGIAFGTGVVLGVADFEGSSGNRGGGRRIGSRLGGVFGQLGAGVLAALGEVAQAEIDRRVEDWKVGQLRKREAAD